MDISVIVVARNEARNIEACLKSILNQNFSQGDYEILVVDGMSTDNTTFIVNEIMKQYNKIKLLKNPKKLISPGRNIGISNSRYSYVAFTDADCVVPKDWLSKLSSGFIQLQTHCRLAAVGGGNIAPTLHSRFKDALGIYLNSFLGSFQSPQGRLFTRPKMVKSLPCLNILYCKDALLTVNGFDEKMGNIAEDLDLNIRLGKMGYKLYFLPDVNVIHKLRDSLASWLKNMWLYGKGRALITHKHSLYNELFFILPMLYCLSMLLIPLSIFQPILLIILAYFPFVLIYSIILSQKHKKLYLFLDVFVIFITTHAIYGFSLLYHFITLYTTKEN